MSLDILQNILLYLLVLISILTFILTMRVSRMAKWMRFINKQFIKLKYEIDKLQSSNKQILSGLDKEAKFLSWIEEDERQKKELHQKKLASRRHKKQLFSTLINSLPEGIDQKAGENVLDKVGIATFLIGLALFINISMDLEWINNYGRLFFGVLLTIIMLVAGYIIKNKFVQFSNILMGGGIGAFIFSLFSSYYQYHLIPLWIWFIAVIFTISTTIISSIAVKRHGIAIITFVAAYIAPFTVEFLKADYITLFSYLTLLNISIFIYDIYQKSIIINLLSFGFTFIIYGIWLISLIYIQKTDVPYLGAFIFLTLFYIIFLMIVIINNVREGHQFKNIEMSIMMTAKAIYVGVGMIIIQKANVDFQGLFAGLIAIINYSFFLGLYNVKNFDRRILNVFLSLAIMFFALIIPFEFYGKSLTDMWSLQAVVLMFIAVRSKNKNMRLSSFMLTLGMILSLFVDFYNHYLNTNTVFSYVTPFINRYFLSSFIVLVSSTAIIFLLPKEEYFINKFLKVKTYKSMLFAVLFLIFYFSVFLELKTMAIELYDSKELINTVLSIFNIGVLTLLTIPIYFKKIKPLAFVSIGASVLAALLFVFHYAQNFVNLRYEYLIDTTVEDYQFRFHYITLFLLVFALFNGLKSLRVAFSKVNLISYFVSALLVFFFIFTISSFVSDVYVVRQYQPNLLIQDLIKQIHALNYSIVWAIITFCVLIFGFIFNLAELRMLAIILFIVDLLKLLIYDYWKVSNQDMMFAFAVIGFTMLLSSFIFQIFKNKIQNNKSTG